MTKTLLVLLVVAGALLAQEPAQLMKQAAELERRAETLLDAGRRPEALALLVQAADLRQKARELQAAAPDKVGDKPAVEKPRKQKKPVRKKAPKARRAGPAMTTQAALTLFDEAVAGGDMAQALKAARAMRKELARWQRQLEDRERKLAARQPPPRGGDLERRLTALERELAALKRQLQQSR